MPDSKHYDFNPPLRGDVPFLRGKCDVFLSWKIQYELENLLILLAEKQSKKKEFLNYTAKKKYGRIKSRLKVFTNLYPIHSPIYFPSPLVVKLFSSSSSAYQSVDDPSLNCLNFNTRYVLIPRAKMSLMMKNSYAMQVF